jgi:tRNA pseudouridine55 synthase
MIIDGILLLDKPPGLTSNRVLQKTKRLFKADKAGHTGCLDPLATGMLPICLGEATKFSRFFIEEDKRYRVEARLGITTTTGDAEGDILTQKPVPEFSRDEIVQAILRFMGTQTQVPPMYSAVKHNGKPLYKLARRGIEIERKERTITIHEFTLDEHDKERLVMTVTCSKGTYIRTLVEDLGNYLGCGAFVTKLHRLWVAPFQSYPMVSLDELVVEDNLEEKHLIAIPDILSKILPAITLAPPDATKFCRGQVVFVDVENPPSPVMLLDIAGQFMGIGEIADNQLTVMRLLSTAAVAAANPPKTSQAVCA